MVRRQPRKKVRSSSYKTTGDEQAASGGSPAQVSRRRRPRQERAKETVTAILQAATELFAASGLGRTTTNQIAERAGISIGSLYQYYPNKDAILVSLFDQHHHEVHAIVGAAMKRLEDPGIPFDEALRLLFLELIEMHEANPELSRALSEVLPHPPSVKETRHGETDAFAQRIERMLRARPEVRVRDYSSAAYILAQTTRSLTQWLAHEAPSTLDKRSFVDEAVEMVSGYVIAANQS